MIPAGFIQDLLARLDIVEIVGRHVELRKAGVNHKGLCPFHGEKTPSFIVSPTRQTYHCFGCGVHGDAVRFLTEHAGLGFVEAVEELAQQVGLQVPDDPRTVEERAQEQRHREARASLSDVLGQAGQYYRKQLKASTRAVNYLKRRGLSGEVAARFGLGYAPEGWRSLASAFARYDDPLLLEAGLVITQGDEPENLKRYDRFRDRIMFPIRSVQGEVIGFGGRVIDNGEPKYLNSPETPVFSKGRELYGLHEARTDIRRLGHALVVEGYMDVVALAQNGLGNAVATLGTACTEDHVRKLFRFTESVVFSFDGDAAGRRAASRALQACLPHASDTRGIRFLFLPAEHDPDSFVRELGEAAFKRAVDAAVPLSRQLLLEAQQDCDMATPEGRSKFLSQARPLWQQLPDGALRRQMLGEISRSGGLSAEELGEVWRAGPSSHGRGAQGAPRGGRNDGRSEEQRALGAARRLMLHKPPRKPAERAAFMLLTHPQWWSELSVEDVELLHGMPGDSGRLLNWLERDLADAGPRPWAVVRAALTEDAALGKALAAVEPSDPAEQDAEFTELRHAIDLLLLDQLALQQRELAARAATDPQALEGYRQAFERSRQIKLRTETLLATASNARAGRD